MHIQLSQYHTLMNNNIDGSRPARKIIKKNVSYAVPMVVFHRKH
jgi:hypothetical protein